MSAIHVCSALFIFQPMRMCAGLFSIGIEMGPFPGAAYSACWSRVEQTLTLGCPVGRPARVANCKWKSHVWTPVCWSHVEKRDPSPRDAFSYLRPRALISFLMAWPRSAAYLLTRTVVYFDVYCVCLEIWVCVCASGLLWSRLMLQIKHRSNCSILLWLLSSTLHSHPKP